MREIQYFLLRALRAAAPTPMNQDTLLTSVKNGMQPRPLESDIVAALHQLESTKHIEGHDDALDGRAWALTTLGAIKAKNL